MGSNGTTIDSLNIEIKADSKKATQSLRSLGNAIEKLNDSVTSFANNDKLSTGIRKMNLCVESLSNSMNKLDARKLQNLATVFGTVSNKATESARKISKATSKIQNQLSSAGKVQATTMDFSPKTEVAKDGDIKAEVNLDTSKANTQIADMTLRINDLKKAMSDMSKDGIGFGFKDYDNAYMEMQSLKAKVNEYKNSLGGVSNETKKASIETKTYADNLKKVSKNSSSASKSLKIFKNGIKSNNLSLNKGFKTILKYAFGIKSMYVLMNKIRNAFKVGSNNLVQYSDSYNQAISSMHSALIKLKNAFAVAFAPIVEIVAPYITKLINLISTACNYLGQFFGYLTGKNSVAQAKDVWEDYAKSVDNAGNSTKKLLGLQGFDKLNNLSSGSSGGSSGGGSLKATDMFETKSVGDNVKNLVDSFKKAWESEDWSWFYNKGLDFGTWISNALKKIDWNTIKINASKVGSALAGLLNGFVKSGIIQTLGTTLGESLNTALSGLAGFIKEFDFAELGKSITESLGNFYSTLDYSLVGETIVGGLAGCIDFVAGLVEGVDWKNLPSAIATKIKDFLDGADWKALFSSVGNLAGQILGALINITAGLVEVFGDIATKIRDFLLKKIKKAGWSKDKGLMDNGKAIFTGILNGILEIKKTIGNWIYENMIKPFAKAFDDALKDNVFYQKGKSIIQQVIDGFKSLSSNVVTNVTNVWNSIKNVWSTVSTWFSTYVTTPIKNIFDTLSTTIKKIFEGLWIIVQAVWVIASTWFKTNVADPICNAFKPVENKVKPIFTNLWSGVKSVWDKASNWFKTKVGDPIVAVFTTVKTSVSSIFTSLGSVIKKGIGGAINGVIGGVEGGINGIITVINSMLSGFNNVVKVAGKIAKKDWSDVAALPKVTIPRIPTYASGGYVNQGQMFIAREKGAELVGNINGTTGVMNNDQIVESVSQGVARAVASVLGSNSQNVTVVLEGDAQGLFKAVRQQDKQYRNMNGHSAFAY